MSYFVLWSEWDVDENNKVFTSTEAGLRWLQNNPTVARLAAEDEMPVDEAIQSYFLDGFMGWKQIEIIE